MNYMVQNKNEIQMHMIKQKVKFINSNNY